MMEGERPESVCSLPCPDGYSRWNSTACCWACRRCEVNEIVTNEGYNCTKCKTTTWPDDTKFDICLPIAPIHSTILDPAALGMSVISLIGAIGCVMTIVIFYAKREDRLIKASSIGMSNIILIGLMLCYLTAIVIMVTPSNPACYFQR